MSKFKEKKSQTLKRREFLKAAVTTSFAVSLPVVARAESNLVEKSSNSNISASGSNIIWASAENESRYPVHISTWQNNIIKNSIPYAGIVTSLNKEYNYECKIIGNLPTDLQGTLLRSGPGLFERGEMRRRILIDADGMIRRFQISEGRAFFSNKHIRTPKFISEEKAKRYLHPSFAMKVPPSETFFRNSVANLKNQASVLAFEFGGRVFSTDEMQPLTELDPLTLATKGEVTLSSDSSLRFMAHVRITNYGGKKLLHLAAIDLFRNVSIYSYDESFSLISKSDSVKISRNFHDWLITPDYYIFVLSPSYTSTTGLLKAIAGLITVSDAIEYRKNEKTQILLIPRNGAEHKLYNLPENVDTFHLINAYQNSQQEIVVDYIGSKVQSGTDNKSIFAKIMRGDLPITVPTRPTNVYRTIIDIKKNHITYGANYFSMAGIEMPTIDSRRVGLPYDNAFFIAGPNTMDNQIVRLDVNMNIHDKFTFTDGQYVTEPVFAPSNDSSKAGYLLSEIYNSKVKKSYLAVFDAAHINKGPIAHVDLEHHLPIGFHGTWSSRI